MGAQESTEEIETCKQCFGSGNTKFLLPAFTTVFNRCQRCKGSGYVIDDLFQCPNCQSIFLLKK